MNCNQMSAMQRNGRYSGNVNCNCGMNANAAMSRRGCDQRCRMQNNRDYDSRCERQESISCNDRYERQESRSCDGRYERQDRKGCERQERRNCDKGCERQAQESCKKECDKRERRDCEKECDKREPKSCEKEYDKHYKENRSCNTGCGSSKTVQDDAGRRMEVECVCKVKSANNCHKDDPMEKLGSRFPVAMAYVPWQQWGELYDAECGLMQGTIFKDLNKIFCGVR